MKVAILGRTRWLLDTARALLKAGHTLDLVWTSPAEDYYGVDEADFKRLAEETGAEYRSGGGIGRPHAIEHLRSLRLDVGVSINWPTRIPPPVIDCFRHGVLNAHAGDLPRYRGNATPNWAILQKEPSIGLCIHQMVEEIDAGPIVIRDNLALKENTYVGEVYDWLAARIPVMFSEALEGLESGALKPQAQPSNPTLALRCYPRRPEDSRLHWNWSVERLYAMVRASSHPFAGAFCFLENNKRIIVWRAVPESHAGRFLAIPGQVCYLVDKDPVIACSDGFLRLTEVEAEAGLKGDEAKKLIGSSMRNRLT